MPRRLLRREFLRGVALGGLGASLSAILPACRRAEQPASIGTTWPRGRVRGRAQLGRTELRVSDIGFGSFRLDGDADLVRYALDCGIDYFDTAESYTEGEAERTLGRALAGVRDRIVLATKVVAEAEFSVETLMGRLEASLRRLGTDYVDVYLNHAVNDVARLANPAWGEFVERARQQGKLRFAGMSGHGHRLIECLDYALDHHLADVVLVAYNYAQSPSFLKRAKGAIRNLAGRFDVVAEMQKLPAVLERAHREGVGVICMKTLRGARLNDLRAYETNGATFAQAAFRWVLAQDHVDSLVVTMASTAQIDEYLGASGGANPDAADLALLDRYEALNGRVQCRSGCSACAAACPNDVAIPEVLRARMYAEDYGAPASARSEYASLGGGAAACLGCASESCANACPHGLDIAALTRRAHRTCAPAV
jgi:predicted aldo/keto reductase-like oxidoreductase